MLTDPDENKNENSVFLSKPGVGISFSLAGVWSIEGAQNLFESGSVD